MDLSSWESIGAGGASLISKVQQMTKSLTGDSGGESSNSTAGCQVSAIPFANDSPNQKNEEVWLLGRKYFSQTGLIRCHFRNRQLQ